jgi:hypothetical protein
MGGLKGFFTVLAMFVAHAALTTSVQAQGTVHRVLIADTFDPKIGTQAGQGLQLFGALTQDIAGAIQRSDDTINIVGSDFTCSHILNTVRGIAKSPDDVVIIFYAGHGFRDPNQSSKFPKIYCDHAVGGGILFEQLVASIKTYATPRMIWAIADACNVTFEEAAALPSAALGPNTILAYKKLFAEPKGQVIMAGAQADEFSWYWATGGQFTSQLIKAVNKRVKGGQAADWHALVGDGMQPFLGLTYKGPNSGVIKTYDQIPEPSINLQLASGPFVLP